MQIYRTPRQGGRFLSVMDTGPADAPAWFYCHGIPGSKKEVLMATARNKTESVRLIAIDRPGYGGSTQMKSYRFADHTDDVQTVAEQLQINKFSLLGFSGGGVFAMATATALKERVNRVMLVGTPAVPIQNSPYKHAGKLTAETWHAALTAPQDLITQLADLTGDSALLATVLMDSLSDQERQFLQASQLRKAFQQNLVAATQQGSLIAADSIVRDIQLMAREWPFSVGDLGVPIEIFHGEHDALVHLEHGQALTSFISGSVLTALPYSGHYDTLIKAYQRSI